MLRPRLALFAIVLGLVVTTSGCAPREEPAEEPAAPAAEEPAPAAPEPLTATAELQPREGSAISGAVTFTETDGGVAVSAHVSGVERAGLHGFHVHETGDCSAPDFTSAGGHFNPTGVPHGGPDDPEHHAGDLGNLEIDDAGHGMLELTSDLITLSGPNSVVGKAVILHEGEDDLVSQPTGDAGGRLACGVVTLDGEGGMMDEPAEDGMEEEGEAEPVS